MLRIAALVTLFFALSPITLQSADSKTARIVTLFPPNTGTFPNDIWQIILSCATEQAHRLIYSTCKTANTRRQERVDEHLNDIRNMVDGPNKKTMVKNFAYEASHWKLIGDDTIECSNTDHNNDSVLALGDLHITTLKPFPGGKEFGAYIIWHSVTGNDDQPTVVKTLTTVRKRKPITITLAPEQCLSDVLVPATIPSDLKIAFEKSSQLYYKKCKRAETGNTYYGQLAGKPIMLTDHDDMKYYTEYEWGPHRHKIMVFKTKYDQSNAFLDIFSGPGSALVKHSILLFNGKKEIPVCELPHLEYLAELGANPEQNVSAKKENLPDGTYTLTFTWNDTGIVDENYMDKLTLEFDRPGDGYTLTTHHDLLALGDKTIPFAQVPLSIRAQCVLKPDQHRNQTMPDIDQYHVKISNIYAPKYDSVWGSENAQQHLATLMQKNYKLETMNDDQLVHCCTAALLSNFNQKITQNFLTQLLFRHTQNTLSVKYAHNPITFIVNLFRASWNKYNPESKRETECQTIAMSLISKLEKKLDKVSSFESATQIVKSHAQNAVFLNSLLYATPVATLAIALIFLHKEKIARLMPNMYFKKAT